MADWTNPLLTSLYSDFLNVLKDRDFDLATQFNANTSSATNVPVGAIRWNPTAKRWETRNVSNSWENLVARFDIDVEKLGGQAGSYYLDWNNLTNRPTSFTPSSHTHDDRYFTETEANARFGFSLDASGNNTRLKAANGTVLASLEVPYAAAAGNATTVNSFNVNQNLRTTDTVSFDLVRADTEVWSKGILKVGQSGGGNSQSYFWDDTNSEWRTFRWNDSGSDWQIEDASGTMHDLFYGGRHPDWSEVDGKPTSFTPSAHGHAFNSTNRLQLRSLTATAHASVTGLASELMFTTDDNRLHVHDGSTAGGQRIAYTSDIPAQQDLSNYARTDQATTFTSNLTVNGSLTGVNTIAGKKFTATDTDAASSTKRMFELFGDGASLAITNFGSGDYDIGSPTGGNAIRIYDIGSNGVHIRADSVTRMLVKPDQVETTVPLTIEGNTAWHAGNDGDGSGLDADKLDGLDSSAFFQPGAVGNCFDFGGAHQIRISVTTNDEMVYTPRLADDSNWAWDEQLGFDTVGRHWFFETELEVAGGTVWHSNNDGPASGLDADMLDGQHASAFAGVNHNHDDRYFTETEADARFLGISAQAADSAKLGGVAASGFVQTTDLMTTIRANDGVASGLDADLLDGQHGSYYLAASAYTAADVLAKIKTVDGTGSGLNAEYLAGVNGAFYRDASNLNAGTVPASRLSGSYSINAATATKLATARTISLTGAVTGSVAFDGSGNASLATTMQHIDVGRGIVYVESHTRDATDGAGVTFRSSSNPTGTGGSIFAVRSSGNALRLWVGQEVTSFGDNDVYFGTDTDGLTNAKAKIYTSGVGEFVRVDTPIAKIDTDWQIKKNGSAIGFYYQGTCVAQIAANGKFTSVNDVEAYGTV